MINIDPRTGSGELAGLFKQYGVDINVESAAFGDFNFIGSGPNGAVGVGFERKRMNDFVASMRDKRLAGYQLPGLLKTYDFVYLILEGIWKIGDAGQILVYVRGTWRDMIAGSRKVTFKEIDHFLSTLTHLCGVNVLYTATPAETVEVVVSRYQWWSKDWDKHGSYIQVYAPYEPPGRSRLMRFNVGLTEKWAAQLYGVDKKALEIAKYFGTPKKLANGTEEQFKKVVGKKLAEKIVKQISGGSTHGGTSNGKCAK